MNAKELKPLLEELAGGTFFSLTAIKRTTGERRVYNCRLGVHKFVTGEGMTFAPEDRNLIVVWDKVKNDYRMVNCDTIEELTIKGKHIIKDCKFVYNNE